MATDPSYGPKVHHRQGGNDLVVESGGVIDVLSGGELRSAGTAINVAALAAATTANLTSLAAADRLCAVEVVALAAVDTAGGLAAWTAGARAIVHKVILDRTTATSGACTIDVGIAANGTTVSDTLLDGVDGNATAGIAVSTDDTDNGTNGVAKAQVLGSTQYVTASTKTGASAGIVGSLRIYYELA